MKFRLAALALSILIASCGAKTKISDLDHDRLPIEGTWKLLTGTLIEKGDTTVTDYTKDVSFIKIINDTHFAFLQHSLKDAKDSTSSFDAGGGKYTLKDSTYTEYLEYCKEPEWEGHNFTFIVTIRNDTLTQRGIEKIDSAGINRLNIEKYVRLKN